MAGIEIPGVPFPIPGDPASWAALATSLFTLWQTAFKRADLKLFVPATIRYASPYSNSNFELFEIPLTVLNQGARTGTVLALTLEVEPTAGGPAKHFFAAGQGQWSLETARGGASPPFTPIALAGRTSRSQSILFHARADETVMQVMSAPGDYRFTLRTETALARDNGILARIFARRPRPVRFEMRLPHLDHRAFTSGSGTIGLYNPEYKTSA